MKWINDEEKELSYYLSNKERVSLYCRWASDMGAPYHVLNSTYKPDVVFDFYLDSSPGDVRVAGSYFEDGKDFLHASEGDGPIRVKFGDHPVKNKDISFGPYFIKSRIIGESGFLIKLNKSRHWNFSLKEDVVTWDEKKSNVIWRGGGTGARKKISDNREVVPRYEFCKLYSEKFNVGFSGLGKKLKSSDDWGALVKGVVNKEKQLRFKYIVSLEGNDVATNLKWILASNSVPIMPKPSRESWLLESKLIPYVHYVPLNDTLDNLEEVFSWCLSNDEHCRQIAENGKRYMEMFFDEENEREIYRMIYERYKKFVGG